MEIDVAAKADRTAIFGEAKWRNEKVDRKEVEKFIAKASFAVERIGIEEKICVLLSKSGFTASAKTLESEELILIDLDELPEVCREIRKHLM